jgi:hypothetical protein
LAVYINKLYEIIINKGGRKCNEDIVLVDFPFGFNIFCQNQNAEQYFGRPFSLPGVFSPTVQNVDATFTSTSFADWPALFGG